MNSSNYNAGKMRACPIHPIHGGLIALGAWSHSFSLESQTENREPPSAMKTLLLLLAVSASALAAPPEPKFRAVTIDDNIQIGYGLAIADVDGDKRPDILLADKRDRKSVV